VSYDSDDDETRELLEQLRRVMSSRGPGVAKVDPRDRARLAFHRMFVEGVNALLEERQENGERRWNLSSLAAEIGVDRSTFNTWYHYGFQQRNQIQGWVMAALPKPARPRMARAILEWSEPPPPSRTGTDG
jgi:hypothetical protein